MDFFRTAIRASLEKKRFEDAAVLVAEMGLQSEFDPIELAINCIKNRRTEGAYLLIQKQRPILNKIIQILSQQSQTIKDA